MAVPPNSNGDWRERMDRVEGALDRLVSTQADHEQHLARNEAGIADLIDIQKRTMTVVESVGGKVIEIAEAQRRTDERLDKVAEAQRRTDERLDKVAEHLDSLTVNVNEISGKLDGLIGVMDDFIRRQPPQSPQ